MIKIVIFEREDEVECPECQRNKKAVKDSIDILPIAEIGQVVEEE